MYFKHPTCTLKSNTLHNMLTVHFVKRLYKIKHFCVTPFRLSTFRACAAVEESQRHDG